MSLPTADDLFRPTADGDPAGDAAPRVRAVPDAPADAGQAAEKPEAAGLRNPSGRVKHDQKVTVYVTSDELLHIEQVRLALRGGHGLAVDRGRLVREALALVLTEFEEQGADSALVRRLSEA